MTQHIRLVPVLFGPVAMPFRADDDASRGGCSWSTVEVGSRRVYLKRSFLEGDRRTCPHQSRA
jgi:hypothetical protein